MKIKCVPTTCDAVTIADLRAGECFHLTGCSGLYMRVGSDKRIAETPKLKAAVTIETGRLCLFPADRFIERIAVTAYVATKPGECND